MMFGAQSGSAPAAPAPASQTMMFGAVDAPQAPPAKPAVNQTMMFGAVGAPLAPPAGRPPSQTMMFGAAGSPPAAPTPAPAPANQGGRTMMFGIPTAEKPNAEPVPSAPRSTMMFGAVDSAPATQKLTERTVRILPEELDRMMREHGATTRGNEMTPPETEPAGAPHHQKTQMFAMADIAPPAAAPAQTREQVEERHSRTAMFAMTPEGTPVPAPSRTAMFAMTPEGAPAPAPARTAMFAMTPEGGPVPAAAPAPARTAMFAMTPEGGLAPLPVPQLGPEPKSNVKLDPSLMQTLPPGPMAHSAPPRSTMMFGAALADPEPKQDRPKNPDLISTTLPNLPPLDNEQPRLPDQPETLLAEGIGESSLDDPALALQQQVTRRNRLALTIVVLAILGAAGAVGWKVLAPRFLRHSVPLEAMQGVENGLAELRKDDSASKANAIKILSAIIAAQPTFVDAHAGLVTALTLQLDDLQQRTRRLEKAAEDCNLRIGRYNQEKPAGWEAKANALSAEFDVLKKERDPLAATAHEIELRLRESYKVMQGVVQKEGELNRQSELALFRAQALFHAYAGSDEALKLTKRYQSRAEGQTDGWIDLVDAEYAANTRASPELVESAQKQLAALHERDPTFFRTYVLAARLDIQGKQYDEAEAELEKVKAMKPQHDIANELSGWIKKAKKEKSPAP
jgi:tetratricopeptide (TPR) repeat protein